MNACACTHPDQASSRQTKPLVIEITERELVEDTQEALRTLQPLLDFGLRLALDDFGSGYSSYRYLLDLPFHFLKIEGELVRHITTNNKAKRIVQHIQNMAVDLGLITVAEFITDQATAQELAEMGIDWGQGFYLGKPALMQSTPIALRASGYPYTHKS
jgi:EAL domain-containing protein (putative c-di-GMP-specific phosphodiesterase class I)